MGLLSWWYGEDEARAEIARTEELLRIENEKDAARLGEQWRAEVAANQRREAAALKLTSDDEFQAGWDDAVTERRGQFGSVISLPFQLIPWQLWLIILAVLFYYVGGVGAVKRKVSKL